MGMFGLLKLALAVVVVAVLAFLGATVSLGKHTLFGHLTRIWNAAETRELVAGTAERAGPTLERFAGAVAKGVAAASEALDAGPPAPEPEAQQATPQNDRDRKGERSRE